jgi:hypothetical protein
MKKSFAFVLVIFFAVMICFAQVEINSNSQKDDGSIKKIYVKTTLPDETEFTALVAEDGALKITIGGKYYEFEPRAIDIESKSAFFVNTYSSLNAGDVEDFQFEILDIISSPIEDIKTMPCECCITCGGTTVCACAVKMCQEHCCCNACCNTPL